MIFWMTLLIGFISKLRSLNKKRFVSIEALSLSMAVEAHLPVPM